MKPILAALALVTLALPAAAQTAGQSSLSRKKPFTGSTGSSSGSVLEHFTIANGQLIGRTSAGGLAGLTIGSGLSLSGTTLSAAASSVAIGDVTGLQTALDGKASVTGSYANPSWITSLPFSKLTALPTTLTGHGITEFATNAFKLLTSVADTLVPGDVGTGWVGQKVSWQMPGGALLQFSSAGAEPVMTWSGRIIASAIDVTSLSIFTAVPVSSTAPGAIGQMAQDGSYFYICVALNSWKRIALSSY